MSGVTSSALCNLSVRNACFVAGGGHCYLVGSALKVTGHCRDFLCPVKVVYNHCRGLDHFRRSVLSNLYSIGALLLWGAYE